MPKIYAGSPANTTEFTSDVLSGATAEQYTLALWSHCASYVDVTLEGSFESGFSRAWTITTVTACAGGATGSGRSYAGSTFFPYKRARAALSANPSSASGFEIWLENKA